MSAKMRDASHEPLSEASSNHRKASASFCVVPSPYALTLVGNLGVHKILDISSGTRNFRGSVFLALSEIRLLPERIQATSQVVADVRVYKESIHVPVACSIHRVRNHYR